MAVLQIETIRQAALQRIRAAIAAANQVGAPTSPLKPLKIPKHRFERWTPRHAPFLHVVPRSDGGDGEGHSVPYIDGSGTIHFLLFCACGRDQAADLDGQAIGIAEAIIVLLLEDASFLRLFQWVEALRVEALDAETEEREYDIVLVQIELVVKLAPVQYEPRDPDERNLDRIDIRTTGPASGENVDLT